MSTATRMTLSGAGAEVLRAPVLPAWSPSRRIPAILVMCVLSLLAFGCAVLAAHLGGLPEPGLASGTSVVSFDTTADIDGSLAPEAPRPGPAVHGR